MSNKLIFRNINVRMIHPNVVLTAFFLIIGLNQTLAQGINFLGGNFQSAAEAAKRANKILFVEVYLTGCPHCAALAPVLEEKKVGDFFNSQFVSYKVEANSEDSKMLQQQKGITYVEFPLFFFFDPSSGQLIHQAAPTEQPSRSGAIEEVIKHGRDALDPTQRTSSYPSRFAKGDRDLGFLINYAKYTKATKDTERLWILNKEIAKQVVRPSDIESQAGFYILSRLINDIDNPMAAYFFNNLSKFKAKYPAKEVKDAGETILYYTMYGRRANDLTIADITKCRKAFVQLGLTAPVASGRTILKELEAYFRNKETAKAVARLNEYVATAPMSLAEYAYMTRLFNEKATGNSYVPSLLKWVNDGVRVAKANEKTSKLMADLYLQQSVAYQRIGKKVEAKKAIKTAVEVAQAAKVDVKPYTDQLEKVK